MVDVAMTETARLAHYVLPAVPRNTRNPEFTLFNFEFPTNYFHVRAGVRAAAQARCRSPRSTRGFCRALGDRRTTRRWPICGARRARSSPGLPWPSANSLQAIEILGGRAEHSLRDAEFSTLPDGAAAAAVWWQAAHKCAAELGDAGRRAGIDGEGF